MSGKHRAVPVRKTKASGKRGKLQSLFFSGLATFLGHDTQALLAGAPSTLGNIGERLMDLLENLPW